MVTNFYCNEFNWLWSHLCHARNISRMNNCLLYTFLRLRFILRPPVILWILRSQGYTWCRHIWWEQLLGLCWQWAVMTSLGCSALDTLEANASTVLAVLAPASKDQPSSFSIVFTPEFENEKYSSFPKRDSSSTSALMDEHTFARSSRIDCSNTWSPTITLAPLTKSSLEISFLCGTTGCNTGC